MLFVWNAKAPKASVVVRAMTQDAKQKELIVSQWGTNQQILLACIQFHNHSLSLLVCAVDSIGSASKASTAFQFMASTASTPRPSWPPRPSIDPWPDSSMSYVYWQNYTLFCLFTGFQPHVTSTNCVHWLNCVFCCSNLEHFFAEGLINFVAQTLNFENIWNCTRQSIFATTSTFATHKWPKAANQNKQEELVVSHWGTNQEILLACIWFHNHSLLFLVCTLSPLTVAGSAVVICKGSSHCNFQPFQTSGFALQN